MATGGAVLGGVPPLAPLPNALVNSALVVTKSGPKPATESAMEEPATRMNFTTLVAKVTAHTMQNTSRKRRTYE